MPATYEIWLDNDRGERIEELTDFVRLAAIKAAKRIGTFNIELPGNYNWGKLRKDYIIEVWRAPEGGAQKLFNVYFIRRISISGNGEQRKIEISGPDMNYLLQSRIIYDTAGSAGAAKTDEADDMIKAIVDEQMVSDADTDRNLDFLTVAGDLAAGPSITKAFAYRNVYDVSSDIAAASEASGTPLYWDFVSTFSATASTSGMFLRLNFETYTSQPGQDRTEGTDNQIIFGPEWDNTDSEFMQYDWFEEITVVYGGGQGEGASRDLQEVEDTTRSGESLVSRREAFADAREGTTSTYTQDKAYQRLDEGEPVLRMSARLLDTPQSRFGLDWNWGDKVTMSFEGVQVDAVIDKVMLTVDERGEQISGYFEVADQGTFPLPG